MQYPEASKDSGFSICTCDRCASGLHAAHSLHCLLRKLKHFLGSEDLAYLVALLRMGEFYDELDEPLCNAAQISLRELEHGRRLLLRRRQEERENRLRFQTRIDGITSDEHSAHLLRMLCLGRFGCSDAEQVFPIKLNLGGEMRQLCIPSRNLYALYEILIQQNYYHERRDDLVHTIYDLGAHIGLASLYLHAMYPEAKLVCVEPSSANIEVLNANLMTNVSEYMVHRGPIAGQDCEVQIQIDSNPSMINSSVFGLSRGSSVAMKATALSRIIRPGHYGVKIDVEGAEFELESCPDLLRNAMWILGEIHYGDFSKPNDRWFIEMLRDSFQVVLLPPRIDKYAEKYIVSQGFRAFHHSI